MRVVSGFLLWLVATVIGLIGAVWFAGAGLGWSNGFIKRGFWEDGESEIGIAFSILLLVVWLTLLGSSFAVFRGGDYEPSRGVRVTATVLAIMSIAVVTIAGIISIGWPEPPSEHPLPPWNRA